VATNKLQGILDSIKQDIRPVPMEVCFMINGTTHIIVLGSVSVARELDIIKLGVKTLTSEWYEFISKHLAKATLSVDEEQFYDAEGDLLAFEGTGASVEDMLYDFYIALDKERLVEIWYSYQTEFVKSTLKSVKLTVKKPEDVPIVAVEEEQEEIPEPKETVLPIHKGE